jgi:hypothetical protein
MDQAVTGKSHMKVITTLIVTGLLFVASGQSTSSDTTKSDAKKTAPKKTSSTPRNNAPSNNEVHAAKGVKVTPDPPPPTIPSDAKALQDGSFRYVDKNGKAWIYRNTPFGVSKAEERPAPQAAKPEDDPATAEDAGDSVRFTRPTPFGNKTWTKKKTELDSYEKTIWERDQKAKGNAAK